VWRKELKDSFFRFGYGVKLKTLVKKQDLELKDIRKPKESRKHPRRQYNQFIHFADQSGIFEGTIKNISSSGVFLMSKKAFEVGEILTLVLPIKNGKFTNAKGQIIWTNDKGFGIKFLSIDK
jgi:flagellar basal body L-ring protein FlgH